MGGIILFNIKAYFIVIVTKVLWCQQRNRPHKSMKQNRDYRCRPTQICSSFEKDVKNNLIEEKQYWSNQTQLRKYNEKITKMGHELKCIA